MEKVTIGDVDPDHIDENSDRRRLSAPLGATGLAINHYRLAPGEGLPGGLHAHADQEEVFVVVDGEAIFETMDGETTVGEGEAIRFAPGEFQSGRNDDAGDLVVLALGAPRDTEDVRVPVHCQECDHDDLRLVGGEDGVTFVCPECGAERIPRDCPRCGHEELRITLGEETSTVVVCRGCGAEFESPPFRE